MVEDHKQAIFDKVSELAEALKTEQEFIGRRDEYEESCRVILADCFLNENDEPSWERLDVLCRLASDELAELRRELRDEPTKIGDSPMLDDGDIGEGATS